ncbi:MAG: 3-hexulose-6-phosphate synthase [Clostridia bacterium]
MPKLQVALDTLLLPEALLLVEQLQATVDLVEVGTPFLLRYGLEAIGQIKTKCPSLEILCDGKIMDAGGYEAEMMYRAGADWVTVMAVTDDATIQECVSAAQKMGGRVMADMLCVTEIAHRVQRLEALGVDCIAVHTGVDQQRLGRTALGDLRRIKNCATRCEIAVAGGITCHTLDAYLALFPDIFIVGSGITEQPNPLEAAAMLQKRIRANALLPEASAIMIEK